MGKTVGGVIGYEGAPKTAEEKPKRPAYVAENPEAEGGDYDTSRDMLPGYKLPDWIQKPREGLVGPTGRSMEADALEKRRKKKAPEDYGATE